MPVSRGDTHSALIELKAAVIMRPGQRPPNRNTKLAVVARNALTPILGDDQVAEIEKQVETGKLSLADLNALASKGKDTSTGILSLIFGTTNPQDVALDVLHDGRYDGEIEQKSARKELSRRLASGATATAWPAPSGGPGWQPRPERPAILPSACSFCHARCPLSTPAAWPRLCRAVKKVRNRARIRATGCARRGAQLNLFLKICLSRLYLLQMRRHLAS